MEWKQATCGGPSAPGPIDTPPGCPWFCGRQPDSASRVPTGGLSAKALPQRLFRASRPALCFPRTPPISGRAPPSPGVNAGTTAPPFPASRPAPCSLRPGGPHAQIGRSDGACSGRCSNVPPGPPLCGPTAGLERAAILIERLVRTSIAPWRPEEAWGRLLVWECPARRFARFARAPRANRGGWSLLHRPPPRAGKGVSPRDRAPLKPTQHLRDASRQPPLLVPRDRAPLKNRADSRRPMGLGGPAQVRPGSANSLPGPNVRLSPLRTVSRAAILSPRRRQAAQFRKEFQFSSANWNSFRIRRLSVLLRPDQVCPGANSQRPAAGSRGLYSVSGSAGASGWVLDWPVVRRSVGRMRAAR